MEMIGVYTAMTTTANNVVNIPVPRKGRIRGIQFVLSADLDADLEYAAVELSLLPVFQGQTNNTRNLLFFAQVGNNLTTSGALMNVAQGFYPMDIQVDPLQILYVNCLLSGTGNASLTALLHFA